MPAHHAALEDHVDVLKLLIKVGQVDLNAIDKVSYNIEEQ